MSLIRVPAERPCGSCPYRCDVPSGVWSEEEYEKLPTFDGPIYTQPPSVFLCHRQDGRLCAGWVGCHDMDESLGLRMAVHLGRIDPEDVDAICDYRSPVELFLSGAEAAEHGLSDVLRPGEGARKVIDKLRRRT